MRITRDQMLMQMAEGVAMRGTCSRAQVGAVLAIEGRTISIGYNGAPARMPHCEHLCDCDPGPYAASCVFEGKQHSINCNRMRGCEIAVHAEVNAIAFAAKHGVATSGADLFSTHSPCVNCCKILINAGLTRVVYRNEYRITTGLTLLQHAGIKIEHLPPVELA